MTAHVADRLLDAVVAQLAAAGVADVFVQPLASLAESDLPAFVIDAIEDEVVSETGFFPVEEQHRLSFDVFACDMTGRSSLRATLGALRHDCEVALVGSESAKRLGGLLTRGLKRSNAIFRTDAESLQKPVGGWAIRFECTYVLRSDAPGALEKE